MKYTYWKYIEDVKTGKKIAGLHIKQAIARFEEFISRDDMYFDEEPVNECIEFISIIHHHKGKCAGKPFICEPWEQFIIAAILGVKWKDTGLRVCRETYIQVARKAGKDALMAAIALYMLIADGENSPEIACLANSRDQARILFSEYITKFSNYIDPKHTELKLFRNYIKCESTDGIVKVYSADASKLDGLNISCGFVDEYHEAKDRQLYDVMKSSQGMREQPLMFIISTAGFNLDGPCHDMYELSIQVLAKVKTMDNFFPFIWDLDEDDDWQDEKNWEKCQPNLDVTVTREYMREEANKALMDSTAASGVLTKTFNKWVQSKVMWIPQNIIANLMKPVDMKIFEGKTVILGADLSTVSDFSSLTLLLPPSPENDDKFIFKTWVFLPENTIKEHPNRVLYEKFIDEGTMIVTPGNVIDNDFIIAKIGELAKICNISGIYLDKWNAISIQVALTERGYNVQEFSQAIGNYNGCTKEFERLAREGKIIIDKSSCVLWQFGNAFLKTDFNGNTKPSKESASKKIDSVISITTALGAYLKEPVYTDFSIFVL